MPSKEIPFKSELIHEISSFLDSKKRTSGDSEGENSSFIGIIEFIERFKLLPYGLYPVQKFIVKLYYGEPLDTINRTIKVSDRLNTKTLYNFTEAEYLKYLFDNGRCNIGEQDGRMRRELILCLGRRSGKSALSSIFASYELYKLLRRGSPQSFYGMPYGSEIRVLCVANDKEQASIVYGDMQSHVESVDYFKNSIANTTQTFLKFRTANDKKKFGDCLVGDSLILSDMGLIRLKDICPTEIETWGACDLNVAAEGASRKEKVVASFNAGYKAVISIITKSGYSITGSLDHRVKVLSSNGEIVWRRFEEITENDYIGIHRKTNLWPKDYAEINRTVKSSRNKLLSRPIAFLGKLENWVVNLFNPMTMPLSGISKHAIASLNSFGDVAYWNGYQGYCIVGAFPNEGSSDYYTQTRSFSPIEYNDIDYQFRCGMTTYPEYLDEEKGELMGALLCNSANGSRAGIQDVRVDHEFLKYLKTKFARLFGSYEFRNDADNEPNEENSWGTRVSPRSLRWLLEDLGCTDSELEGSRVPSSVLRSPKSVVSAFLKGLFETNGTVSPCGVSITFTSASKYLASEVQLLLLNFGIVSSISENSSEECNGGRYSVSILGFESLKIFRDEIGFIADRKNFRLDFDECLYDRETIPNLGHHLMSIIDFVCDKPEVKTELESIGGGFLFEKLLSGVAYDVLNRFIDCCDENEIFHTSLQVLRDILCSSYYWDPVSRIDRGESITYDLHVPESHSYVAQGMTSHNSGKGTITATFKSSIAKGLRGRGIICAILDEIAFFVDNGNSSAERVYKAIAPSLAQFSPKDVTNKHIPVGPTEGLMILISSPDAREGFFYRQHQLALSNNAASSNMLLIQAPTWEVNPTLSSEYYTTEYYKDPRTFMTEHGAEFSDRVRGWIEDETDLEACLSYDSFPATRGLPREPHFLGLDLGLVNDGTVVAITKIENGIVKLVYHEVWYARVSWKESNPHLTEPLVSYARTLQEQPRLDLVEIAEWIRVLSTKFYLVAGLFDQWTGIVLEQELHKRGLKQLEMRNFTPNESSQMYQTFKMLMYNKQLSIYDYPCTKFDGVDKVAKHSPLVSELLQLQATVASKNIVSVEAPNAAGKHDDMSDALARAIYLASDYLKDSSRYASIMTSRHSGKQFSSGGYHSFQSMKVRLHGSNKQRTASAGRKIT